MLLIKILLQYNNKVQQGFPHAMVTLYTATIYVCNLIFNALFFLSLNMDTKSFINASCRSPSHTTISHVLLCIKVGNDESKTLQLILQNENITKFSFHV